MYTLLKQHDSYVNFDKEPGHYSSLSKVTLSVESPIASLAYSVGSEPPPAISQYIAYDDLVPPNPFLAVTQDGLGNVVYDGGFPKFYNQRVPNDNYTFDTLPAGHKFLHNAILFCANPEKVAQGNRKVLVIGDRTSTYRIDGYTSSDFGKSIDIVAETTGFEIHKRNINHFPNNIVLLSLSELEEYAAVIYFSTASTDKATSESLIAQDTIQNLVTYRENRNGLIVITDHGPNLNTIEEAINTSGGGFFVGANRLITNFGAWFSGDYNRQSVNVGFLRDNYGDHPLYNGMSDSEFIFAGGSESEVRLNEVSVHDVTGDIDVVIPSLSVVPVNILGVQYDGSLYSKRFLYTVGNSPLLEAKDIDGVYKSNSITTYKSHLDKLFRVAHDNIGDVLVEFYNNSTYLGKGYVNRDGVEYQLIDKIGFLITSGTIICKVIQPFLYTQTFSIDVRPMDTKYPLTVEYLKDKDYLEHPRFEMDTLRSFIQNKVDTEYKTPTIAGLLRRTWEYVQTKTPKFPVEVYVVDAEDIVNRDIHTGLNTPVFTGNSETGVGNLYIPTEKGYIWAIQTMLQLFGDTRQFINIETRELIDIRSYTNLRPLGHQLPIDNYSGYTYSHIIPLNGDMLRANAMLNTFPQAQWIFDIPDLNIQDGYVCRFVKRFYVTTPGPAKLYIAYDGDISYLNINFTQYLYVDDTEDDENTDVPTLTNPKTYDVMLMTGWNSISLQGGSNVDLTNTSCLYCVIYQGDKAVVFSDRSWLSRKVNEVIIN